MTTAKNVLDDAPAIRRPAAVDRDAFAPDVPAPVARYGLPGKVVFCKRCVISNQRPNSTVEFRNARDSRKTTINIDADGICDACRTAERKEREIDWAARERELRVLCDRYRSRNGSYDCIVPGSGGKDSFYASHKLRYEYGMHPLTVTWAPHIYTEWGWRNFQRWLGAGFDNMLFTPNPRAHRLLTRLAIELLFHPFQPFILGQKNIAPRVSIERRIPLVFYGESEAEYGNPIADTESAVRDQSYFAIDSEAEILLSGVPLAELIGRFGLERCDLDPYLPANASRVRENRMEVHYLGYYLKWHPQSCYYYSVEHGGFEASPERTAGTYSKYNSIDDRMDDFHYFTTFIKFGIGRATYDAAQEIRSGDIERDEGAALVRKFDGEFPERFADELFRYLSIPGREFPVASQLFEQPEIDRDYFLALADTFRSPHLWRFENGAWTLRHAVWSTDEARNV